jgi:hypothetical protein
MFSQVWKKYLPVISILIKRSINEAQVLEMNHLDFERAAGGRKIKFNFSGLNLNKGRIENGSVQTPLAKELAQVLQEDAVMGKYIKDCRLEFSMNLAFKLNIKQVVLVEKEVSPDSTESNGA